MSDHRDLSGTPREPLDDAKLADWGRFVTTITDIPTQRISTDGVETVAGAYALPLVVRSMDRLPSWVTARASDHISCDLDLTVDVPPGQRGIHLSRLAELAVAASTDAEWQSIGHLSARLALDATARQNATGGTAELRGSYHVFVETPRAGKRSLERIIVGAKAVVRNGSLQSVTGSATVTIMSACPCTLTYTKYDRASWLATRLADFELANESLTLPSYTHSQRAHATAFVETSKPSDCLHVLLDALNSTCRLTRTVLKRPDEHSVVKDAHSRPQFTEDIARSIVASVCEHAQGDLTDQGLLAVGSSCRAIESIHGHDAYASAIRRFNRDS